MKLSQKEKQEILDGIREGGVEGNIKYVRRKGNILKIRTGMEEVMRIIKKKELIKRRKNLIVNWKLMKEISELEKEYRKYEGKRWRIKKRKTVYLDGKTGKKLMVEMEKFRMGKF